MRLFCFLVIMLAGPSVLLAQPRKPANTRTDVFSETVVIRLPLPYEDSPRPSPPVHGFYAWRMSFGGDPEATVVLRVDSAISTSVNRPILRAAKLYWCAPDAFSILECTAPLRGNTRLLIDRIEVNITAPEFLSLVRQRRPAVLFRSVFEPGGRFRVDRVNVEYHGR